MSKYCNPDNTKMDIPKMQRSVKDISGTVVQAVPGQTVRFSAPGMAIGVRG